MEETGQHVLLAMAKVKYKANNNYSGIRRLKILYNTCTSCNGKGNIKNYKGSNYIYKRVKIK